MLQLPLGDFIWFQNVVLPVLGMGMGAFVLFGVYRTINRHLDRRHEQQLDGRHLVGGQGAGEVVRRSLRSIPVSRTVPAGHRSLA